MRLGVLDIGSNTVHLLLVDAHPGARPVPYASHKRRLSLVQFLDDDGPQGTRPEGRRQEVGPPTEFAGNARIRRKLPADSQVSGDFAFADRPWT